MTIKVIETNYKGYRFRSRLEARFAVFFDALGVAWEYEKEGYLLPSGCYLPDFWLACVPCWVEIKPTNPTVHEAQLVEELCQFTRSAGCIISGSDPGNCSIRGFCYGFPGEWSWPLSFSACICGKVGICQPGGLTCEASCRGRSDQGRIEQAIIASRSARFEHGETPQ